MTQLDYRYLISTKISSFDLFIGGLKICILNMVPSQIVIQQFTLFHLSPEVSKRNTQSSILILSRQQGYHVAYLGKENKSIKSQTLA